MDDWSASISLRQHVTIRWSGGVERFEAVLEKRPGRLRLVGLGPMTTPGFVLTLDADGLEVVNRTGRAFPFEPAFILADVQRTYYPWTLQTAECKDCPRDLAGIDVVETQLADGAIVRTFRTSPRDEASAIDVRIGAAMIAPGIPERAVITNGWLGYEIEVETSTVEPIPRPMQRDRVR